MSSRRICPHCGAANNKEASFCGACASQLTKSTALVRIPKKSFLPTLSSRDKAALGSVAVGVTAMALRVGKTILEHMLEQQSSKAVAKPKKAQPLAPSVEEAPALRIRRRWVIHDGSGTPSWGEEEIEVHNANNASTSYRISLK